MWRKPLVTNLNRGLVCGKTPEVMDNRSIYLRSALKDLNGSLTPLQCEGSFTRWSNVLEGAERTIFLCEYSILMESLTDE